MGEHEGRTRDELVAAYVRWSTKHDDSDEWAWEAIHDGVWWTDDSLEMLDVVVEIINRIGENHSALEYVGAGPLEDLLGGHEAVMTRAAQEARTSRAFRIAVASVDGVRFDQPGYEELNKIVHDELAERQKPS